MFQLTALVCGDCQPYYPAGHPRLRKQRVFHTWEACQEYACAGDLIILLDSGVYPPSLRVTKPVALDSTDIDTQFICDLDGGSEQWKSSHPYVGMLPFL